LRSYPRLMEFHVFGLYCGNTAVSRLPPLPLYGVMADDENVCGISFRYAPTLKMSYMPPRRYMNWSVRPKFSP